jgi:hypothetical protein
MLSFLVINQSSKHQPARLTKLNYSPLSPTNFRDIGDKWTIRQKKLKEIKENQKKKAKIF